MNLRNPHLHVLLGALECRAFDELNDVADYIWKSPRLLTHEKNFEQEKMAAYFPNGGEAADDRRHHESTKLNATFPRLIALGNLFAVLSVFENYVLLLLQILREHDKTVPEHALGRGISDHLKATKAYGAEPYNAKYYEQVCIAISIRNCLMHANGLLAVFGKAEVLKTQIVQRRYLLDNRKGRTARGQSSCKDYVAKDYVAIEDSGLGDQVVVTNSYSHLVCFYVREYFCALCGSLNPNTALRPLTFEMDPEELAPEPPYQGPLM